MTFTHSNAEKQENLAFNGSSMGISDVAQAIIYDRFGGADVLNMVQSEKVEPGPGQICIRVYATTVNPIDIKIRRGDFSSYFPVQFPATLGVDAAGIVTEIGKNIHDIGIGDEVFGSAISGSYSTYAILENAVVKPKRLSWEFAACLNTIGETAFRALKHLNLDAGATLAVFGAAGGVGSLVTQLAVKQGIRVIGIAAPFDRSFVEGLGGEFLAYGEGVPERAREASLGTVDAVLDTCGAGVLPLAVELAGDPARVLTIADLNASAYGVRSTGMDPTDRSPEALPILAKQVADGNLLVRVWRSFPLSQTRQAHEEVEMRRARGKVILLP